MWGDAASRVAGAVVVAGAVHGAATGCGDRTVEPATTDAGVAGGLPEYCAGQGGDDAAFWESVHASCRVAQDGDAAQADALGQVLADVDADGLAQFQRTLVRLNRDLRRVSPIADPDRLRDFPDAEAGCGLGEPFGAVALDLYLRRTGRPVSDPGLPVL